MVPVSFGPAPSPRQVLLVAPLVLAVARCRMVRVLHDLSKCRHQVISLLPSMKEVHTPPQGPLGTIVTSSDGSVPPHLDHSLFILISLEHLEYATRP